MANWAYHTISFADSSRNLQEELVNKGILVERIIQGTFGDPQIRYFLDVEKANPAIFQELLQHKMEDRPEHGRFENGEYIFTPYTDDEVIESCKYFWVEKLKDGHGNLVPRLNYDRKWTYDTLGMDIVSKLYPNEVMECFIDVEQGPRIHYYVKDGKDCTKTGEKSYASLLNIQTNRIQDMENGTCKISIPIEENGTSRWISLYVDSSCVDRYNNGYRTIANIFFTKESYKVYSEGTSKWMTVQTICNQCAAAKHSYSVKMNQAVEMTIPAVSVYKREGTPYHIITLPVPVEVSDNQLCRMALSDEFVQREGNEYKIKLYTRGSEHSIKVIKNGQEETIRIRNEKLEQYYQDFRRDTEIDTQEELEERE